MNKITGYKNLQFLCFSFVIAFGVSCNVSSRMTMPYDIQIESTSSAYHIDSSNLFFRWKITSNQKNVVQTAYQIQVASSLQKLNDEPDIWDSKKIISDKNIFVRFKGDPLLSSQKYYYRVRLWTNKNNIPVWSAPKEFITGIMKESEWSNSKWIGYEALPDSLRLFPGHHALNMDVDDGYDILGNKALKRAIIPAFRKSVFIKKKIKAAYIHTSGLGQYVAFINGKKVGDDFLTPAWSEYTKRIYYDTYEVSEMLQKGENVIASVVGTGFFYIHRERYRKFVVANGYPMFRMKLVIRYEDGTTEEIVTNNTWLTSPSEISFSSIYGGEDVDATKEQKGWKLPGFNGGNWQNAIVVPSPGGTMQTSNFTPIRIQEKFTPVYIDSAKQNYRMYDFGQNLSGIIRFKATGPQGFTLRITPGELLNADNSINQNASGGPYYWQYTFAGSGEEEWQPVFTYYGFRYAGIEVFDNNNRRVNVSSISISAIQSLHTRNDVSTVGSFECSDTLMNNIFKLIDWSVKSNLSYVTTDCPHREKLGWLEVTHLMGNSIQYNYDIHRLYRKIVLDMIDSQLPDGLIPDIAPEYVVFDGGFRDSPEWGSSAIILPWQLYQWYGDEEILTRAFPMMQRYLTYLGTKSENNVLMHGLGDWADLGPGPIGQSQLTPAGITATAIYYYDAVIMEQVALLLGKEVESKSYSLLAYEIKKAFNQKFYDHTTRIYGSGSQTSMAMPLYFGLTTPENRDKTLSNLVDSLMNNNYALTPGDVGFRYLLQVLENNGRSDIVYKMNNRNDVPGYGFQMKKGATALTESWPAYREVSNNHMMLGHLMEWFYSALGGIKQQPESLGYKKILIEPTFIGGINHVHCSYESINGTIKVSWQRQEEKVIVHVVIPPNTSAKIILPGISKEIGSGTYNFKALVL